MTSAPPAPSRPRRRSPTLRSGLGESMAVRRLHDRAVIREAAPGVYYLDEEVWTAVRRTRRRVATFHCSCSSLSFYRVR